LLPAHVARLARRPRAAGNRARNVLRHACGCCVRGRRSGRRRDLRPVAAAACRSRGPVPLSCLLAAPAPAATPRHATPRHATQLGMAVASCLPRVLRLHLCARPRKRFLRWLPRPCRA
jgi:hypothetical protein